MLSITHASASVHTNSMVVGTKVVISDNVTKIKGNEFAECKTIKRIIVSKNNKFFCTDKKGVLYNKKKTRLILCPRNLTGSYKVPEGVKSIAGNAFRYCKQLKKVTLPNSVEQIGTSAFEACTGLKKIKFSKNTKIIGIKAFYQCKQLQKIVIPNKVERICRKAFWYCNSLQSVTIPDSVENMKGNVFGGCTNLEKIIVEEGNKRYFTDENGVLFSKKKTRLMACPGKCSNSGFIRVQRSRRYQLGYCRPNEYRVLCR